MGSDAELVVLSMGLAIRDMAAIHFVEDDDFPRDFPAWVRQSPFGLSEVNRLMNIWNKHLVTVTADPSNDSNSNGKDNIAGKGKSKTTGSRKKRDVQSLDNNTQVLENQPQ